jgi:hypothetical protein
VFTPYNKTLRVPSRRTITTFPSEPSQVFSIDGVNNCIDFSTLLNETNPRSISSLPINYPAKLVLNGIMCCELNSADSGKCNQLCDAFYFIDSNGTLLETGRVGGIESSSFTSDLLWGRNVTADPHEYSVVLEGSRVDLSIAFFLRDLDCSSNSGSINLSIYESLSML